MLRPSFNFAGAFVLLAVGFLGYFNVVIRVDPNAALSRFNTLIDSGAPARAVGHGERALAMQLKQGANKEDVAALKTRIAAAQIIKARYARASVLLEDALATNWAQGLDMRDRIRLENELGRAYILSNSIPEAVSIYASFLDHAGDAAAHIHIADNNSLAVFYAEFVTAVGDEFTEALDHTSIRNRDKRGRRAKLVTANHMASLGGFYSMREESTYAASSLLSIAYETRRMLLGGDHKDTVQLALILGPLYTRMGKLDDAEELYLEAFHAQEQVKGANNPDLSLYIRLLAGVYEQQGRLTEAQAMLVHMRNLFRDAFGEQRYEINQDSDRRADINRPVSQYFMLEPSYAPDDLVPASSYSIPTGKAPELDEMKLRLAADPDADPREANLPVRLAQLISSCRSESGEQISLRSGYRSYSTQHAVHQRNGNRGTVTPAGMSEHQTGLAADINISGRFMRQSDRTFQCFEENAFRFGFLLSYPPNNGYLPGEDSYEPWHWRYVGVQTAHLYREAGPYHKPQEFLAALPCYRERAANGIFPAAGMEDICLSRQADTTIAATSGDAPAMNDMATQDTARILNNGILTAQSRQ